VLLALRCRRCTRAPRSTVPRAGPEALAMLLRQHVQSNNFAIRTWEGEMIVNEALAVQAKRPRATSPSSPNTQLRFQRDCGLCHTPAFLYRRECDPPRRERLARGGGANAEQSPAFFPIADASVVAEHALRICSTNKIAP